MFLLVIVYLKNTHFFYTKSDGDKSYTKSVAFVDNYIFVVHTVVIGNHFGIQIIDIIFISKFDEFFFNNISSKNDKVFI
jgi:hypothetical protein